MSDIESITSIALPVRYADIEGYPGYRVGDDGSIWSCHVRGNNKGRVGDIWQRLKPFLSRSGHLRVNLVRADQRHVHQRYVHQLVLEAFVGPCPPGMECRHFPDRDPTNNRLENIHWGTPKQNAADRDLHGTQLKGEACPSAILTRSDVLEALAMHRAGKGATAIARFFGVGQRTIQDICHGRTWTEVTGLRSAGRA